MNLFGRLLILAVFLVTGCGSLLCFGVASRAAMREYADQSGVLGVLAMAAVLALISGSALVLALRRSGDSGPERPARLRGRSHKIRLRHDKLRIPHHRLRL